MPKASIAPPTSQPPIPVPEPVEMSLWSRPTRITVTTPGTPPVPATGVLRIHELPDEAEIQCIVAPMRRVNVRGREYLGGSVVMLPASRAHQLRRVGDLMQAADSPRDAA
jgi:hypothetical protein